MNKTFIAFYIIKDKWKELNLVIEFTERGPKSQKGDLTFPLLGDLLVCTARDNAYFLYKATPNEFHRPLIMA